MPLYDLNIPWTPATTLQELDRILLWVANLGYDIVALNHIISKPSPGEIINPIPIITGPLAPTPGDKQQHTTAAAAELGAVVLPPRAPSRPPFPRRILRRATVLVDDVSQHHRLAHLAAAYDILAVRPTSEKAFLAACATIPEASIISLDLTQRLGYYMRHKPVSTAVRRGVRFEVCYSHALAGPPPATSFGGGGVAMPTLIDDATAARVFGNWEQLFTASRGRGIIVSSEARRKLHLRAPAAVRNLLAVYGLADEKGHAAQTEVPRQVVGNDMLKRSSHGGVVQILKAASKREIKATRITTQDGTKEKDVDGRGKDKVMKDVDIDADHGREQNTQEQKDDTKDTDGNKKRKAEAETTPSGSATISKRQAKRLRKQMRDAQLQQLEQANKST